MPAPAAQELLLQKRFEREAQVTASLRSPHTVALYDFGQSKDGAFYYVMELLEGIDLQTLVDRFGPMEPARVVHILHQVSQSLEEAHRAGLVHRDIKPRNILLGKLGLEYDFAKVLDFGLVKTLHPDDPDRTLTTMDGVTTGTPAYLSPEVAMGNRDDRRTGGPLQPGLHRLLPAHRPAGVRRADADGLCHRPRADAAAADERAVRAADTGRARSDRDAVAGEGSGESHSERAGTGAPAAQRCRTSKRWSPERAEQWWETNLPELTLPTPSWMQVGDRDHGGIDPRLDRA